MTAAFWIVASAAVILATPTVIGVFDGVAYEIAGDDATISRLSQRTAWGYPPYQWSVCFLFGVLCGHLFTTRPYDPPVARWVSLALFVAVPYVTVLVTLVRGLRARGGLPVHSASSLDAFPEVLLALTLGAAVGAYLLHQTGD